MGNCACGNYPESILGILSEMGILHSLHWNGLDCVLAFTQILNALSPAAFGWLLAGGIIYTIGGIIYA